MKLGTPKMEVLARANVKKAARKEEYEAIKEIIIETLRRKQTCLKAKNYLLKHKIRKKYLSDLQYHVVRDMILNDKIRLDGRGLDRCSSIGYGGRCVANSARCCIIYKR